MRESILKYLLNNMDSTVSGEEMSRMLGITRAAVWKHIKALRESGHRIEAASGGGYVLKALADDLNHTLLEHYQMNDWPVKIKDSLLSTNIEASQWAESGAPNGAVVIARQQTGGRGRRGRAWTSPEGGLWMSSILRTSLSPQHVQPYALLAAAAVCQSLEQLAPGLKPRIKWPNDLLVHDKKLCGILTELSVNMDEVKYIIVGIGVNSSFSSTELGSELQDAATTLKDEGFLINRAKLAAGINDRLIELSRRYEQEASFSFLLDYYQGHLAWLDEWIEISGTGKERRGILRGINTSGALLLEQEKEMIPVISGEISVRRAAYDL